MRQVSVYEMKADKRYKIVQHFSGGTVVTTEGRLMSEPRDSYAYVPSAGIINLHPHVGMPNVEIWEV